MVSRPTILLTLPSNSLYTGRKDANGGGDVASGVPG